LIFGKSWVNFFEVYDFAGCGQLAVGLQKVKTNIA
jgi:hypothetical protein